MDPVSQKQNSNRLAFIGTGEIGLRHLQALQNFPEALEIVVADLLPAKAQAAIAKCSWSPNISIKVVLPEELEGSFDVAVIATTSATRFAALQNLLERSSVKYCLLEKILFQKTGEYEQAAQLLASPGTKAWVNCSRRQYPCYRNIRQKISGLADPIEMLVSGSRLRLGTNLIHFIDLLAYLSGEQEVFPVSHGLGLPEESKRPGYLEFDGTVSLGTPKGSFGLIQSHPTGSFSRQVLIRCGKLFWHLDEGERWMVSDESSVKTPFVVPLQSELTDLVVRDLIHSGSCHLATFAESTPLHLEMLRMFNLHLKSKCRIGSLSDPCPVS